MSVDLVGVATTASSTAASLLVSLIAAARRDPQVARELVSARALLRRASHLGDVSRALHLAQVRAAFASTKRARARADAKARALLVELAELAAGDRYAAGRKAEREAVYAFLTTARGRSIAELAAEILHGMHEGRAGL